MKCAICGGVLGEPERKAVPYRDLPGVTLEGVETRTCPSCGDVSETFPRFEELHRVLAHAVANRPGRLTGAEIRFLRKSLGWSGAEFAEHFDTDKTQVSKWETEARQMEGRTELLLRLVATRLELVVNPADVVALLDRIREPEDPRGIRLGFEAGAWHVLVFDGERWVVAPPRAEPRTVEMLRVMLSMVRDEADAGEQIEEVRRRA